MAHFSFVRFRMLTAFVLSALVFGCGGSSGGGGNANPTEAWGTAQLIATDKTGAAGGPQLAVDPNGNALAVWHQSDGTRFNAWANRYTAATDSWGTARLIETDNAGDAFSPQIAVDANGNGLAAWQQFDGTRDAIWANRYAQ